MKISFFGAAGCVTGSCFLVETEVSRFLVDCGMFQGPRELKERNYRAFPFDPAKIETVILTHTHIDHSGLIPKLFKKGFRGKIYATPPTLDLCGVVLPDSGFIQETEVRRKNAEYERKKLPPLEPIYTVEDALECLKLFKPVDYDIETELQNGVKFRFRNAGHVMGSAIAELFIEGKKLVFSGDLGRAGQPIIKDPYTGSEADILVIESTYGGRLHKISNEQEKRNELKEAILTTLNRKGNIIVPAFAVERTQDFLYDLNILRMKNEIPQFPVYVDSPLAAGATKIFQKNEKYFDEAARELNSTGGAIVNPELKFVEKAEDSKKLNDIKGGIMIISSSGMCEAGRIKHHIKNNIGRDNATILIIGYQAPGTLGRRLADGEKSVRIHGEFFERLCEVRKLEGFSAHKDQRELLEWVKALKKTPQKTFIAHGEPDQAAGLGKVMSQQLGINASIPAYCESFEI